jgi:hypothetical protein
VQEAALIITTIAACIVIATSCSFTSRQPALCSLAPLLLLLPLLFTLLQHAQLMLLQRLRQLLIGLHLLPSPSLCERHLIITILAACSSTATMRRRTCHTLPLPGPLSLLLLLLLLLLMPT